MALFKIFKGNETALLTGRPKAQEGFCYFCLDTGKFYIDIAGDGTSTDAVIGTNRIPINAYQSNLASLATVSTRIPFGTCTTVQDTNIKTIAGDSNNGLAKELLLIPNFDTITAGYPEVGTMLIIYFENACNIADISFKIPYIGTVEGEEIPVYYKGDRLALYSYLTWDAFSLKQFVFMRNPSDNNSPVWRMIEEDKYNVDVAGNLTVNGDTYLNNETYAEDITTNTLLVLGDSRFILTPQAPTAAAGTSDNQLATTEFVTSAINSIANEKLIIGTIEYDGSEEITIPIYDGAYTIA